MSLLESPRLQNLQQQMAARDFTPAKQDSFRQECADMDVIALTNLFNDLVAKSVDPDQNAYDRAIADKKSKIAKAAMPAQS